MDLTEEARQKSLEYTTRYTLPGDAPVQFKILTQEAQVAFVKGYLMGHAKGVADANKKEEDNTQT